MKRLFLTLALASSLQASIITFSASATSSTVSGNQMAWTSQLAIPLFDPALGTLDSMSYRLTLGGRFNWYMSAYEGGDISYSVGSTTSFLGATQSDYVLNYPYALTQIQPCGTAAHPNPCVDPLVTGMPGSTPQYCSFIMAGTLSDGQFQFRSTNGNGCGSSLNNGTASGDLGAWTGNGNMIVPVSTTIWVSKDAWQMHQENTVQSVNGFGTWNWTGQYNYTAPIQISEIAHAPEPNYVLLIAGAICVIVFIRWPNKPSLNAMLDRIHGSPSPCFYCADPCGDPDRNKPDFVCPICGPTKPYTDWWSNHSLECNTFFSDNGCTCGLWEKQVATETARNR